MEWIDQLFGKEDHLSSLQMSLRGIFVFITALVILRIGSTRTFGKNSVIDSIVMIILGGNLSRAFTGAAPFLPVMASTVAIIIIHRLLAWVCMYNRKIGKLIKGKEESLFENGEMNEKNMKKTLISQDDLREGLRLMLNEDKFDHVEKIIIERSGEISVVKKSTRRLAT